MEESTRKGLEATLQASQTELGRARDQLAFFDQLLPPGPTGAIGIRALDIVQLGPTLQYKLRSEEHTSELQSLMRTSYALFCLKKIKAHSTPHQHIFPQHPPF